MARKTYEVKFEDHATSGKYQEVKARVKAESPMDAKRIVRSKFPESKNIKVREVKRGEPKPAGGVRY